MFPHLQEVVGSRVGLQRWAKFLAVRSSTSREAWAALTAEAAATWAYLEEEPSEALLATLEEVGGYSVDGRSRTKVVQRREGREARPVTVYQNISDDTSALADPRNPKP